MRSVLQFMFITSVLITLSSSAPLSGSAKIEPLPDQTVFENDWVRFGISNDGGISTFMDKTNAKDYLDRGIRRKVMSLEKDGQTYSASGVQYSNGFLGVEFAGAGISARVKVEAYDHYFTFELADLSDRDVERFTLMELHVAITDSVGRVVTIARNKDFAASVMGLNMETNTTAVANSPFVTVYDALPSFLTGEKALADKEDKKSVGLFAYSLPSVGLVGIKCAVIGAPTHRFLPLVETIEREHGLPRQTFEGKWGKLAPEMAESYLAIDYTENTVEEIIDFAKRGGFSYIVNYGHIWAKSTGHFLIHEENFPSGVLGVKNAVRKIHDAGLKAGFHILVGGISKNDPYVQPVPDPRIRKDGEYTLAEDIDESSPMIPLSSSPETHTTVPRFAGGGVDIQIDDEIISYRALSKEPPYSFSECQRGENGTKPSPHKKGAKVYHLAEIWDTYSLDAKNSLLDEVSTRIGQLVNECGIDMVYLDNSIYPEVQDVPDWYALSLNNYSYFKKWNRDVIVQHGWYFSSFGWHFASRGCSGDWVCIGTKAYADRYRFGAAHRGYSMNYIPTEFGWWGVHIHTPYCEATYPDELEYIMAKALALGSGYSLETTSRVLKTYGRTDELLEISKNYITLMKNNYFPPAVKKQLLEPGKEFTLKHEPGEKWNIHPVEYGPDMFLSLRRNEGTSFTYINHFHDQPLKFRLRALPGLAQYGDPENIRLEDFDDISGFNAQTASNIDTRITTSVVSSMTAAPEEEPNGKKSGRFSAWGLKKNFANQWCTQKIRFAKPVNLLSHKALGLWVHGDGSGNLLDIQIFDRNGRYYRSHYADLNFSGWKYFEFHKPEEARTYEFQWPYGSYFSGRSFSYEEVPEIGFSYLINAIPSSGKVETCLAGLEALKEFPAKLVNPSISVNGRTLRFPVSLAPEEYLEFDENGEYRVYNGNAHVVASGKAEGEIPVVISGENRIAIESGYECEREARAKLTMITVGKPLTD